MKSETRAVICGWFSYAQGHATAGDLLARDVLCDWLDRIGMPHVTALAPPFTGGPAIDALDARDFTHAFFVCGPFDRGPLEADFLSRFASCRLIGINLSVEYDPERWRPFDLVIERDSLAATNPEIIFASRSETTPVIGICLVEAYPQGDTATANGAIDRLLARRECARVRIDTRLDQNETGFRTKGEVESAIGRMDALVTTRLHGLVLALKNRVAAVAIDPVPGGGKIKRQCDRIGWPNVFLVDDLDEAALDRALDFALTAEAKALAAECTDRARSEIEGLRVELADQITGSSELERKFQRRQGDGAMQAFLAMVEPARASRARAWRNRMASALRKLGG